ncbi:MAG TPA: hypothetical protein DDZ89_12645, partial [Clostridiales bacterium]|nr:hypothetical protein [Clostridiales bacterium]
KAGAVPTKRLLTLTEKGKKELIKQSGLKTIGTTVAPGIQYQDDQGKQRTFVIPFMKFIEELEGLVLFTSSQEYYEYEPDDAQITVYAKVKPSTKSAAGQMGDIGNILGGGDGESEYVDYVSLLEAQIPLPVLSLDAIDIGYLKAGESKYTAFLKSASGTTVGSYVVDANTDQVIGLRIEIVIRNEELIHEKDFAQEDTFDQYHHVIALNLPDLPADALNDLNNRTKAMHDEAENPDSLSALSWYGRNILHRFIGAQTEFDLQTSKDLGLTLGRVSKERCIVVTSYMDKKAGKLRTSMDLLQAANECHTSDEKLIAAYNIGAGMFLSGLEGGVLIGDEKISFLDVWNRAPQGTNIMFIPTGGYEDGEIREKKAVEMKEQEVYPNRLIQAIAENEKVIFTPDKPTLIDGQERWAWLEIDPKTYETISVFDTGEHAGMASYLLTVAKENASDMGMYIVGALMGVEVAVWSVASFSLVYDDYRTILKEAMAVTGAIGKHLDGVMKGYGMALDQALSYGLGGNSPININLSISLDEGYKQAMKQNIVGFSQGYNDGASLYFTMAFKNLKPEDDGKGKGKGSNSGGSGG